MFTKAQLTLKSPTIKLVVW